MKQRLAPFLVLLEARYAPLLFAVAPQSYAVFLWLWRGSDRSDASFWFAVMGALGYELVYVGAIAWAEEGRSSFWTWATAGVALIFSVVVAYYVYRDQNAWAWLHAGFPLVAFTYTLNMHTHRPLRRDAETSQEAPGAVEMSEPAHITLESLEPRRMLPVEPSIAQPSAALTMLEAPRYECKYCGSLLPSKQAMGNAARFGCRNPACPGRSNRKAERKAA